jgi:hypothetical protein
LGDFHFFLKTIGLVFLNGFKNCFNSLNKLFPSFRELVWFQVFSFFTKLIFKGFNSHEFQNTSFFKVVVTTWLSQDKKLYKMKKHCVKFPKRNSTLNFSMEPLYYVEVVAHKTNVTRLFGYLPHHTLKP